MATTQDLGLVTSYGYAVAGGYRGTVDEYEKYLADLPKYTNDAQAAATAATQASTEAQGYAAESQTYYNNTVIEAGKAARSENNANQYATNASSYMAQASQYALNASDSATAAAEDADDAHDYALIAEQARDDAITAKNDAKLSEAISKSWAVGPSATGTSGSDTNNAKYWCDQAQAITGLGPFIGATATTNGAQGLVPGPGAGQQDYALFGDGAFRKINLVYEGETADWEALTAAEKAIYKIVILSDD